MPRYWEQMRQYGEQQQLLPYSYFLTDNPVVALTRIDLAFGISIAIMLFTIIALLAFMAGQRYPVDADRVAKEGSVCGKCRKVILSHGSN